ncbi:MAG: response regulator transcription factor [Acidobacteriia bacterium]|nr:response regulator transcription factor [Terriglobia bacterium]
MSENQRILVVDDEPQITRVLRTALTAHQYEVRVANDGEMALEIMKNWVPHLIITDLMMPNLDGVELCRRVRALGDCPILILSVRGQEQWKVKALDAGADDYVTKPFNMNELMARVRAHLRRQPLTPSEALPHIQIGDFQVDVGGHEVKVRGLDVRLTPKEFDLLLYLVRNAGKVVTHRTLLSAVWGAYSVEQPEYLRVFIGQLRKKIELQANSPRYILTEPWVGYRFNPAG